MILIRTPPPVGYVMQAHLPLPTWRLRARNNQNLTLFASHPGSIPLTPSTWHLSVLIGGVQHLFTEPDGRSKIPNTQS